MALLGLKEFDSDTVPLVHVGLDKLNGKLKAAVLDLDRGFINADRKQLDIQLGALSHLPWLVSVVDPDEAVVEKSLDVLVGHPNNLHAGPCPLLRNALCSGCVSSHVAFNINFQLRLLKIWIKGC